MDDWNLDEIPLNNSNGNTVNQLSPQIFLQRMTNNVGLTFGDTTPGFTIDIVQDN